jgi:hypothetical protein
LTREQPPRHTGNLPAGGLVGAALIHGTAFFGQPPISHGFWTSLWLSSRAPTR